MVVGVVAENFAVADGDGAVGELGDLGVVGDDDDGGASFAVEAAELVDDGGGGFGVEVAGGLVGQDKAGLLASARAMATRWVWPPEIWLGR
jgi:hypothetical protein